MARQIIYLILITALSLAASSCSNGTTQKEQEQGDTIRLKYSELLTIVRYKHYTTVDIANPWQQGQTLHTYVLTTEAAKNETLPKGTVINVPLKRCIPFTSVHSALIIDMGKQEAIAGVADLKYIKLPYIQEQCALGKIANVGNAMMPDVEKIIDIAPDALMISPFNNNGGYGKVEELGIPIIECADYMETSALGRAEWMKLYGMLFGAEEAADSIFSIVDSTYNALKEKAKTSATRPSVLMDKTTGSVWYVPGGQSTIGKILADANVEYSYKDNKSNGSLALSFEKVYDSAGNADLWLFRYNSATPTSYTQLASEHHLHSMIKAFANRKCYGCNVETTLFYEETPFHPELLLNDIITIAHPDIKGLSGLRYYKPL